MQNKKRFWIIGIVTALAVSATAVGCRGMHRGFDEEDMRDFAAWRMGRILDDIDATPAQRQLAMTGVNQVVDSMVKIHAEGKKTHAIVRAELTKPKPDRKLLHALVDERFERVRTTVHQAVDKAVDVYVTLDKEQREELLTQLDKHCAEK